MENKLRALNFEAFTRTDGSLFRVQAGAFSNLDNAKNLGAELKAAGFDIYITKL